MTKEKEYFFEKCGVEWWGGYYVPVKNRWSSMIKRKHLTEKQKAMYENEFGEKMLYHDEFENWILEHLD